VSASQALHRSCGSVFTLRECRAAQLRRALQVGEQQETFRQRGIGFPMGTQLAGKTLGIIGMGNIGVSSAAQLVHECCAATRLLQSSLHRAQQRTPTATCCCLGHIMTADL